jgi:PAS domain S-box-containing protein
LNLRPSPSLPEPTGAGSSESRAADERRESGNLRALLNADPLPLLVVDRAGVVLFANEATCVAVGCPLNGVPLPWHSGTLGDGTIRLTGADGQERMWSQSVGTVTWDAADVSLIRLQPLPERGAEELHLRRANQLYAALLQTTGVVARVTDEVELFEDVCRIAVACGGFRLAWVARPSRDGSEIERVAAAGPRLDYLDSLRVRLDPTTSEGQGPIARTLRLGVPYVCNDFAADPLTAPWHATAARHGIASFVVCPVRSGGRVAAVFAVYSDQTGFFESDLLTLLNQLAVEISSGLERQAHRRARRQAERALAESEERFRQMATTSHQVFWLRDVTSGEMLYLSPAFATVFGRSPAEIVSRPQLWLDLVHPEDRARAGRDFTSDLGVHRFRIVRPDGAVRWIECEVLPIQDGQRIARVSGTATDITERHQAEEQTRLFRGLVEYSSDAFFVIDPADDYRLVFINQAGTRHFGWSVEDLRKKSIWDWDPLFTPEACRGLWEMLKVKRAALFETVHRRADGETIKVEVAANYLRHQGREYLAGFFRDISARAAAEAALRENEEKFRAVFDEAADGLLLLDPASGAVLDCNCRALEMFGAADKGRLLETGASTPAAGALRDLLAQVERVGQASGELEQTSLNGRRFWTAVAGRKVTAGGRPFHVLRLTDITQEKAANAALHEREERLREQALLLDAANDAIILRSLDHTVLFWNRGAERLFGWGRDEALGRRITSLYAVDTRSLEESTRRILEHGAWNGEESYVTKSRTRVLVEGRWTLIRDAAGHPKSILAINTDITEKKRIEARSLRAQRLESIGTLAGGIAHDLNNILAPIILSADMLRSSVTEPGDVELIDTISGSAQRGADVVRQVLSFARGVDSTRVPLNLRHLFAELRKITAETFPRNIAVEMDAPQGLWMVLADPMQVHQVLLNLALNARDAMPDGGTLRFEVANITLDATFAGLVPEARPGPYVRTRVADTGCGIAPEVRERIFDPFFTTKGMGRNSGLGLSTALAIVRAHGGFISVESEVGRGSTFVFYLPAEQTNAPPPSGHGPDLPRGNGERVLVIDDEESVRSIIRQSLEGAGYRVLTAGDGAEALSVFVQHRAEVALVLTDLMMPVMDGSATVEALRRMVPELKTIVMSGVADAAGNLAIASANRNLRFLLKPFTLESLLVTVSGTLAAPLAGQD